MIRIQNIYYMLAYAFSLLREEKIEELCDSEAFVNAADLLSAILENGVKKLIKRGLNKAYIEEKNSLNCLRGKIDISESVKKQTMVEQRLVCVYDDFTTDSYFNRIIKTTVLVLIRSDISVDRKKSLRNLLLFFKDIGELNPFNICWNQTYNRNNEFYHMLLSICYLVIKGLLQTSNGSKYKLSRFFDDDQMHKLYEKFILEYYRKEYPSLNVSAAQIPWWLDEESDSLLPVMQSDITIKQDDKVLIIDAKYYSHNTATRFDKRTLISDNLYQIFTYVKNYDTRRSGNVSGLLLYAQPDDDIAVNSSYMMSGNKIAVKTLNLDLPFKEISEQLDEIVMNEFSSGLRKRQYSS